MNKTSNQWSPEDAAVQFAGNSHINTMIFAKNPLLPANQDHIHVTAHKISENATQ